MAQPTRPVLGYLTTSWAPPAICSSLRAYEMFPDLNIGNQGKICDTGAHLSDAPDCWPPRTANAPHPPSSFFSGWGFYSPGTLCPSGFTMACSATYGEPISDWSLQFPLAVGETAAGCCPIGGYNCFYLALDSQEGQGPISAQTCRLLATSTTIQITPCDSLDPDAEFAIEVPYTVHHPVGSTTTVIDTFSMFAPLIQINWRAEDLANAIPTATSRSSVSKSNGQGGELSGGAIAGVVIGAVFAVVGTLIGILGFLSTRRRVKREEAGCQNQELSGTPAQQCTQPTEPEREVPEAFELPAKDAAHELRGNEVAGNLLPPNAQS